MYLQFYYFCIILEDTFKAVPSCYICHKSTTEGNKLVKLCQKTWATMKRAASQRKILKSNKYFEATQKIMESTVFIIAVVIGNSPPWNDQKMKNTQLNVNQTLQRYSQVGPTRFAERNLHILWQGPKKEASTGRTKVEDCNSWRLWDNISAG